MMVMSWWQGDEDADIGDDNVCSDDHRAIVLCWDAVQSLQIAQLKLKLINFVQLFWFVSNFNTMKLRPQW